MNKNEINDEVSEKSRAEWADDSQRLEEAQKPEGEPSTDPESSPESSLEPSSEVVTLRAENDRLTRERDEREEAVTTANAAAELENEARAMTMPYAQNLVANRGYDEERATEVAELKGQIYILQGRLDASNNSNQTVHLSYGKAEISRRTGVSEESLRPFTTLEQAELYAKGTTGQDKRITDLEQAQRNGAAPVQSFAKQAGTGAAANGHYAEKLKSGAALPSASEIDQITAKYVQ